MKNKFGYTDTKGRDYGGSISSDDGDVIIELYLYVSRPSSPKELRLSITPLDADYLRKMLKKAAKQARKEYHNNQIEPT